ncbi:MAG: TatD family hydrolase [Kiritimatiellae bacterium]|nr:TatD family hydrolase [Kiritimatiellia bacterium]
MRLFDSHCHLQDERLQPGLAAAMQRAADVGVAAFNCCGSAEDDWAAVERLAAQYAAVMPSYGLHPWYLNSRSDGWLVALEARIRDSNAGVGEIGLDHALEARNDAEQDSVFLAQLALARKYERPVSLHCRRAWGRLLELLAEFGRPLPPFVIHSFSGASELIEPLAGWGAHFSFSGSVTRSHNKRAHKAACAVPADRLLIETDAPDIPPLLDPAHPPTRETVNEPANLVHVAWKVAELRGMPPDELAELTWTNAVRVFQGSRGIQ